jgi:hypothetical protein
MTDTLKIWVEHQAFLTTMRKKYDDVSEEEKIQIKDFMETLPGIFERKNIDELKNFANKCSISDSDLEFLVENSDKIIQMFENIFNDIITKSHNRSVESQDDEQNKYEFNFQL